MNFARNFTRFFALLLPILMVTGCAGYRIGSAKPAALEDIHSIAIPLFKNKTLEPRVTAMITNSIIRRFHEEGTYQITTREKADAVLEGTFVRMTRSQRRAGRNDQLQTLELEVGLVADYILTDSRTHVVLSEGQVEGRTDIFLDPNFQLSERQAVPIAAQDLATKIVSKLSDGW
ncbi:MAG: LPS assembly lipoprotein LptE [Verrucomicrobiales bacterium]